MPLCGAGPTRCVATRRPRTGYHWRHLLPLLSRRYAVVAPDLRSLGDSDFPNGGYELVPHVAAGDVYNGTALQHTGIVHQNVDIPSKCLFAVAFDRDIQFLDLYL